MGFKTSCESCIFALKDTNDGQTGCMLGRTEKFENVVCENNHLVIVDRVCTTKRTEDWGTPDIDRVLKEVEPDYEILLYIGHDDYEEYGNFIQNIKLLSDTYKIQLNILLNTDKVSLSQLKYWLNDIKIKWRITRSVTPKTLDDAIISGIIKTGTQYLVVCKPHQILTSAELDAINHAVNHDLKRVILVEYSNKEHLLPEFVVQTHAYRAFGHVELYDDEDKPLKLTTIEKIKYKATHEENQVVWDFESLLSHI